MKTLLFYLLTAATVTAQTTLTQSSAVQVPDATGGPTGEGFTCTGICRHSSGSGWWIMNFGVTDPADVTYSSNIVRVSEDFSTNLGEISLAAFGSASTQGIALDTSDNSLWAVIAGNVRNYSEAGTATGQVITGASANGVAYDAANDRLYLMTSGGVFSAYSCASLTLVSTYTTCPGTAPDHLCMAPNGVNVWATCGVNGGTGTVWEYTPGSNSWAQIFTLTGADAVEGLVIDGDFLRVANDAYYHGGTPAKNRVLSYRFQTSATPGSRVNRSRRAAHSAP